MNDKTSGCLPAPITYLVLIVSLIAILRTGYLISSWVLYKVLGTEVLAIVEQSAPYQSLVRKPRPAHYVTRYKGVYGFSLPSDANQKINGDFDTSSFLVSADKKLGAGDELSVRYIPFLPSANRASDEIGISQLLVPFIFFVPALFLFLMCLAFLHFGKRV